MVFVLTHGSLSPEDKLFFRSEGMLKLNVKVEC